MSNSWVHDPLADRWVIRAPERSDRPDRVRKQARVEGCPFCPGNEAATPAERARVPDGRGWKVRVFPNLYPAVRPGDGPPTPLTDGAAATGAHEVIVTTPDHDASFADLADDQARDAFGMLLERIVHHRAAGHAHAQAFINHGAAAGASIDHPHAQLIALDVVPPRVAAERMLLRSDTCPLCRIPPRFDLVRSGGVRVCVPPWASAPYEALVLPETHGASLHADTGPVLRELLAGIRSATGDVAYNVELHPGSVPGDGTGHPHVHVDPRTTTPGGFERATGIYISPISPADVVDRLRAALGRGCPITP